MLLQDVCSTASTAGSGGGARGRSVATRAGSGSLSLQPQEVEDGATHVQDPGTCCSTSVRQLSADKRRS